VVELLAQRGAALDARYKGDLAALHLAAGGGHTAVVEALAALAARSGHAHPAVAELLLESGADVDARDHGGQTPLHQLASTGRGFVQMAELLLANGADVNATTESGLTPLELATQHDHRRLAALLSSDAD
jgi:ankyrin repeat protein